MDEADFWARLEYRICAEFRGFEDKRLRSCWCDGLVAEEYDLSSTWPCIRGRAWCGIDGQESWRFVLRVSPDVRTREGIDWFALLPPDHMTGWLLPDLSSRSMELDPLAGFPAQIER
jgi:hypothetical protein